MTAGTYLFVGADNVVQNAIIYDPDHEFVLSAGEQLIPYTGQGWIGWTLNADGTFTAPPQPAPEE